MTFFVNCSPPRSLSKNSKQLFVRNGRAMQTDSKNTKESKATILQLFQAHAPKTPIDGPVKLSLIFFYPYPKSTPKKVVAAGGRPMTIKPDADGIASGVMDAMTALQFWKDDAQVYCLRVEKWQSETGGIRVEIEEKT